MGIKNRIKQMTEARAKRARDIKAIVLPLPRADRKAYLGLFENFGEVPKPTVDHFWERGKRMAAAYEENSRYFQNGGINHLPCGSDDAWCDRNLDGPRQEVKACSRAVLHLIGKQCGVESKPFSDLLKEMRASCSSELIAIADVLEGASEDDDPRSLALAIAGEFKAAAEQLIDQLYEVDFDENE